MNKRLATLSLAALLAALTLSSCKGYNYREGIMLVYNGTEYTAADVFKSFNIDTQSGVKAYYDVLNDVDIEACYDRSTFASTVNSEMKDFKDTASKTAKNNGTTYAEELTKALKAKGFTTLEELEDSYYLAQKTTQASTDFYSNTNYNTTFVQQVVDSYAPYHIRHILAKFSSDASSSLYQGTISEADAKKISTIATSLANGETFGSVAQYSDDSANSSDSNMISSKNFGDAGIMTTKTSFVSEFKYGVYTYDAFFSSLTDDQKASVKSKTFPSTALDTATDTSGKDLVDAYTAEAGSGVYGIPYSALIQLNYYASTTKDSHGETPSNSSAYNYPRNVIFNNYFNNHGLSFIYLDDWSSAMETSFGYTESQYNQANNGGNFLTNATTEKIAGAMKGYTEDAGNTRHMTTTVSLSTTGKKILCDEKGNPIMVTRAGTGSSSSGYQGIHFIIIQKDPFTTSESDMMDYLRITKKKTSQDAKDTATWDNSYVGYIETTNEDVHTSRIKALQTDIKDALPNLSYDQFDYYRQKANKGDNGVTVTVADDVMAKVNTYIDSQKASTAESTVRSYNTSWKTYLNLLQASDYFSTRILPVDSAIAAFMGGYDTLTTFNNQRAGK
jgi:hypothetical protein